MNKWTIYKLNFVILFFTIFQSLYAQRAEFNFNKSWKFLMDDNEGFAMESLNDDDWTVLDVPHDWSFEKGVRKDGDQGQGGGYHDGGIGWYRKTFKVEKSSLQKTSYIEFQGVYMNSEVWVNGNYLGNRPYGYISFRYDISHYLKEGENTLAVRVDNSLEPSTRWYHSSGIYAPVKLIEVNPTHIAPNGIYITTPELTNSKGLVMAEVSITTKSKITKHTEIHTTILSPEGKTITTVQQSIKKADEPVFLTMEVPNPESWSPETPVLYTLISQVMEDKKVIDEVKTRFGFRTIEWETATGFWLNGENVKLKGVCEHWEGGPVGGAWTKPMLRWKLELLKSMGINAIRTSHNPFPPFFYDLCDEIGLLVIDEIFDGWHKKARHDYGNQAFDEWWQEDVKEWITRDRNHPSIFIWSIGNETHGDVAPEIVKFCNALDPTRKVTSGGANTEDMQIAGVNGESEYKSFIENTRFEKPFIATEAPHSWATRGHYRTKTYFRDGPSERKYPIPDITKEEIFFSDWADPKVWKNKKQRFISSYDNATVHISARKHWEVVRDNPWFSGHFRWTGFDYYGEAALTHGGLPFNLFMGGAIDVAGFKKDLYFFYQSQWTKEPMVHILPHWTHPRMEKGTKIPVWVYSNADEVELFLNGKSFGKDKPGSIWDEMQCEWMVPYEEGILEAVAYINGKEVKRTTFHTASHPSKLLNTVTVLPAEDGFSSSYLLTSTGTDARNTMYPYTQNKVYYSLNGDVEKVSLENGSPIDSTSRFKSNYRAMFMGKTLAVLQASGAAANADVILGSILGDKTLHLSKQISIVAEQVELFGKAKGGTLTILYTVNGEDPAIKGMPYNEPFEVKDGTTVKAVVKLEDEALFTMEEKFGANEGLFWGNKYSEDMWVGRGMRMQAEDGELTGDAKIVEGTTRAGGYAYVTFGNKEGSISWYRENDGEARDFDITILYTHNDLESKRPMTLTVNDKLVKTLEFDPTGNWGEGWKEVRIKIREKVGANYIELKTTGESGPDIDELRTN
jgi:beta-galactosidase